MTARRVIRFVQREFIDNMGSASLLQSDFVEPTGGLQTEGLQVITAGAGAFAFNSLASNIDHPGIWSLGTGTTAAGRVFLISQSGFGSYRVGQGGITRFGLWARTDTVLSGGANRYTIRGGFWSIALPNTVTNGIGFEYDDLQNGGRWQAITNDGVETTTDTGILVAATTWYRLEWEVNAAGTSVDFFIGVAGAAPTLVATNTTNIPTGLGHFINLHIMKLTGVTARFFHIDAYYVYQELTR